MRRLLDIIFVTVFFVAVLAVMSMDADTSEQEKVEIENKNSYVLIEAQTRAVLDGKGESVRKNGGYMTKLMTILLVAEDIESKKYSLTDECTASQSVTGTQGAVVWLEAGDKMTVGELLKSVIIGNANDASVVLAEKSAGTVEKFVENMNSRAYELGLDGTHFCSPDGFRQDGEFTTAYDVAVVCAEISKYDFLRDYFRTRRDFVESGQTELVNENPLAGSFESHIGFKACHSEGSGYCCAEGGVSENGTVYISVVLGEEDSDKSVGTAKRLVKSGFSDYRVTQAVYPDEILKPLEVRYGVSHAVELKLKGSTALVVPKSVKELTTVTVLPEYVSAPVKKGRQLGVTAFYSGDVLVCETPVVAVEEVKRLSYGYVLKYLLLNMFK